MFQSHVHQGHHPHHPPAILTNGLSLPVSNGLALQNGVAHHQDPPQASSSRTPQVQQAPTEKSITVVGIPSVSVQIDRLIVGDSHSSSTRSYTPLKVLGDGSFGTVWLCDWHGTLPPNTPLSPMQCGVRAKPEWKGKRLVAVKRMKKRWEGGWNECKKLKELESLRAITFHPNIIPLYDFFLLPASKELYFVFESMEGNLYHLIKSRKGRPLAGGLVSSIFQQIVAGLYHVHSSGYFHRDMKPENILVTTTGLFDYTTVSPIASPNAPTEKDVVVIIKLADFGLARETKSKPPYTEYVSTRWYRAPEVLLFSKDYSNPVDMWALGTIMAELVNLRPLFPGSAQIDQIARICEVLGDPSDAYGLDTRGRAIGGGKWSRGVMMARAAGFAFQQITPRDIYSLFDRSVPRTLIHCISDLLKYDPDARLTSQECLIHPYLVETIPKNNIPFPAGVPTAPSPLTLTINKAKAAPRNGVPTSAQSPQSNANGVFDGTSSHRAPFYPSAAAQPSRPKGDGRGSAPWDAMDVSERAEDAAPGQPMDVRVSAERAARPPQPEATQVAPPPPPDVPQNQGGKLSKFGALGFGKKSSKWGIGMFGQADKSNPLPPLDEMPSHASLSLKRTQSSGTDNSSDVLHALDPPPKPVDPKQLKKEAQRLQREAEKQRRALAAQMQRDQARAVMQKRKQIAHQVVAGTDLEWDFIPRYCNAPDIKPAANNSNGATKQQPAATAGRPITRGALQKEKGNASTITVDTTSTRFSQQTTESNLHFGQWRGNERMAKARRREYDDDHSMSSSDVQSVQSVGRMSSLSFATVDSDPGPSRLRTRSSMLGINRVTSRTSCDDFAASTHSSNSLSAEHHLAQEFQMRASVHHPSTPLSGSVSPPPVSPPPVQLLSLSPSLSPSPTWMTLQGSQENSSVCSSHDHPPYASVLPQSRHPPLHSSGPNSPYDFDGVPETPYGLPPSPAPHSVINPIFKVTPFPPPIDDKPPILTLPPFSHMEAVADREFQPLSPMSFHPPES